MRDVTELGRPRPTDWKSRLKERWLETPAVWSRLAEERAQALGPGPKLDRGLFPGLAEEPEEDDTPLEEAMRMLGYGE